MKNIILVLTIAFIFSCNSTDKKADENIASSGSGGESLFKTNCASCHKPDKDFTGPALKGARNRWADKSLLYDFVKNPAAVIAKDKYAKDLQTKFGSIMTGSPQLSNNDIDAILNYCDTYTP